MRRLPVVITSQGKRLMKAAPYRRFSDRRGVRAYCFVVELPRERNGRVVAPSTAASPWSRAALRPTSSGPMQGRSPTSMPAQKSLQVTSAPATLITAHRNRTRGSRRRDAAGPPAGGSGSSHEEIAPGRGPAYRNGQFPNDLLAVDQNGNHKINVPRLGLIRDRQARPNAPCLTPSACPTTLVSFEIAAGVDEDFLGSRGAVVDIEGVVACGRDEVEVGDGGGVVVVVHTEIGVGGRSRVGTQPAR
jgi:hypothetical protein